MKEKEKKKTLKLREYTFRQNLHGYLLIAPAVIAIVMLSIYPLLQGM